MGRDLNIVGCGRTGRALGRLFQEAGVFEVRGVMTQSVASARAATAFIGAGEPIGTWEAFQAASVWMIATPDRAIADTADALHDSGRLRAGDIVFHLSGALSSRALRPCRDAGASVASVHPVQSFADPAVAIGRFPGTWCAIEGARAAVRLLEPAFAAIGGRPIEILPQQKNLYHAGAAMACNYLVTLVDLSLEVFAKAGIDRAQGAEILAPILHATVDNVLAGDAGEAMTGPISRGDAEIVADHLKALDRVSPETASVYRELGRATLALVEHSGDLSAERIRRMRALLGAH